MVYRAGTESSRLRLSSVVKEQGQMAPRLYWKQNLGCRKSTARTAKGSKRAAAHRRRTAA